MRNYTFEKYIRLVENTKDPVLKRFMEDEIFVMKSVKNSFEKTFIDLGAVYGRITQELAKISRNLISVEINPEMLSELRRRSEAYSNAEVIMGDITKLSKLLNGKNTKNPVLVLVQNSLGTIEGDNDKLIREMEKFASENHGEIIISFFKSEMLEKYGVSKLFPSVSEMTGEPDLERTDLEKGIFVSKTGYTAKWWSKKEIEQIKNYLGGKIIQDLEKEDYRIIYISFV